MKIAALVATLILGGASMFYGGGTAPVVREAPQAQIVTAQFGGTVVSVMIKPGDIVKEGQVLLRIHAGEIEDRAGRAIAAFQKTPLATLDRGVAMLDRIPPTTWKRITISEAANMKADEEYVSALSAYEQGPSPETKQVLEKASRQRMEAVQQMPHRDLFDTLTRRHHEEDADVEWLRRQLESGIIRSPLDGSVAIFDLHSGDKVAPNGRIMLIEAAQ